MKEYRVRLTMILLLEWLVFIGVVAKPVLWRNISQFRLQHLPIGARVIATQDSQTL